MPRRLFRRIKKRTASALSAPARARASVVKSRSEADANILRVAREREKEPNFDAQGKPTRGFKARTLKPGAVKRIKKRTQRITNPGKIRGAFQRAIHLENPFKK